jgi:hypothetical protein
MSGKPTDDMISLVAFLLDREWLAADEIRHAIAKLGFRMPTSQWTVARLNKMVNEDAPRFERRDSYGPWSEYRVTSFAHTGLSNNWPGFTTRDYEKRLADVSAEIDQRRVQRRDQAGTCLHLPEILADQLGMSRSEARRIINQGGVKLDGEAVVDFDPPAEYISGKTLKVGKKQEVRVP